MQIKPTCNEHLGSHPLPEGQSSQPSDNVVLHVKSAGLYAALMGIIKMKKDETAAK
jgi:hypothetical protein